MTTVTKKYTLSAPEESDFQMIGITSTLKDFRLAYYLNKQLYLELARSEDLPATIPGYEETINFSFYLWEEQGTSLSYYLISNRSAETFLIQEQKQSDYFLMIKGGLSTDSINAMLKIIRQIPNVITAFKMKVKSDKILGPFLMDMELHTIEIKNLSKKKK